MSPTANVPDSRTDGGAALPLTVPLRQDVGVRDKGLEIGASAPMFLTRNLNARRSGQELLATKQLVGPTAVQPRTALVLSFSASYCVPCRRELPELKLLEQRYQDRGVLFVAIVVDTEEELIEGMRHWLVEEQGVSFPVASDRYGIIARRYGVVELPYLVLVDRDGLVAWVHAGFDQDMSGELDGQLARLTGPVAAGTNLPVPAPQPAERSTQAAGSGR